jgi:hypothetical protein
VDWPMQSSKSEKELVAQQPVSDENKLRMDV